MAQHPTPVPTPPPPPPFPSAIDFQQAAFELSSEEAGLRNRPGVDGGDPRRTITAITMNEWLNSLPTSDIKEWEADFIAWASFQPEGVADFNDTEQAARFLAERFAESPTGGGGAVGRTQFESERLVDVATAQLRQQQAQTEAFIRENQRQQAASQAQDRVTSMFELLQTTDQLADARREIAVQSLISALPFLVNPGEQSTPGFEPFGAAERLGSLLGADIPNQMLPTAELPLNELANPPLAAPPSAITEQLNPLLEAPGQPQIPF